MEIAPRSLSATYRITLFTITFLACFLPFIDAPLALLAGFVCAQLFGHPFAHLNPTAVQWLLKISVVGLGFGINLTQAVKVGKEGFLFTSVSIILTLAGGLWLGKRLGVESKSAFLITAGTAICGGSAIAALSPLVKANEKQISAVLGVIFVLNSLALFVFPVLGQWIHLTQHEFGLWSAIAIHDTSSVIGASARYGAEALQTATTVKLERALWIVPLSVVTTFLNRQVGSKIQFPYFILLFILAMLFSSRYTEYQYIYATVTLASGKFLVMTLFLIGAGLNMDSVRSIGVRPFVQGMLLWIFISGSSLFTLLILR